MKPSPDGFIFLSVFTLLSAFYAILDGYSVYRFFSILNHAESNIALRRVVITVIFVTALKQPKRASNGIFNLFPHGTIVSYKFLSPQDPGAETLRGQKLTLFPISIHSEFFQKANQKSTLASYPGGFATF